MRTRKLGRTDIEIPVVTFGAWALGGGYWGAPNDGASIAALRSALDAGITAFDTAPVYGLGHSEELLGLAFAGRRDDVTILSKVGLRWDATDGELFFESTGERGQPLKVYRNARPDSVRLEVQRSCERMNVDVIDVVQVHWPDPTTPVEETMGALLDLKNEGRIRAIGVCNYDVELLERAQAALGDVPLASHQPKYSLVAREIEQDVLPWTHEHGVGTVVYSPLEQGLLTGKVPADRTFGEDEGRSRRPTFQAENRARVNALVDEVLRPIATAHHATPAQVVIAWTVAQPGVTAALVGARNPDQVLENAAAGDLLLTDAQWSAIDIAFTGLELADG